MTEKTEAHRKIILHSTTVDGVLEVEFHPMVDERGSFTRIFAPEAFAQTGFFPDGPVHINMSTTLEAGTVRGMHWQELSPGETGEAKLVLCVSGRILDVAADVRQGSPTYLKHASIELKPEGNRALLVPPGVAHGIQALEDHTRLLYVNAAPFKPQQERGVRADDPLLGIPWLLPISNLSDRDRRHPLLTGEKP